MKLIFFYGPPAVGKLTVAKELHKLTGISLFHNHLAFDMIDSILDVEEPKFFGYVQDIMKKGISIAVDNDKDIIFTYVANFPDDMKFIEEIKNIVVDRGEIFFFRLSCDKAELYNRVKDGSRKGTGKIQDIETLKKRLSEWDVFGEIPDSIIVDTEKMTPSESAKFISRKIK